MPKEVSLTQGKVALVPDQCYEELMRNKWYAWHNKSGVYYAARKPSEKIEGRRRVIWMHRFIWEMCNGHIPDGMELDHVDGDGLNNELKNLRLCTHGQNCHNRHRRGVFSSKYKGVTWNKECNKWQAAIHHTKKTVALGLFDSEVDAAHAYDTAAKQTYGEFASLNFPTQGVK